MLGISLILFLRRGFITTPIFIGEKTKVKKKLPKVILYDLEPYTQVYLMVALVLYHASLKIWF